MHEKSAADVGIKCTTDGGQIDAGLYIPLLGEVVLSDWRQISS